MSNYDNLMFLIFEGEESPWLQPRAGSSAHPHCGAQTPPRNAWLAPPTRPNASKTRLFLLLSPLISSGVTF